MMMMMTSTTATMMMMINKVKQEKWRDRSVTSRSLNVEIAGPLNRILWPWSVDDCRRRSVQTDAY